MLIDNKSYLNTRLYSLILIKRKNYLKNMLYKIDKKNERLWFDLFLDNIGLDIFIKFLNNVLFLYDIYNHNLRYTS